MIIINHAGNSVEPESVKFEFFKPVAAVGKEEMNNIIFPIVKSERIPGYMVPSFICMKILTH